ncbi:MAG: transporter [Flavobacteriales bacterium]|nr:MAG: transporter [Flavobacteriales bacterium]
MDNFQIETAQNVVINQNVAAVSTRIGAFLLDLLIMVIYFIGINFIFSAIDLNYDMENWFIITMVGLPLFFYHLAFEVLNNGQSPGKMLTNIRVVKVDGSKPTLSSYILRWMLRAIDISIATGSIGLLTILLNGKGQRLGDLAAGTTVITERKRIFRKDLLFTDLPEDYKPTYGQVTLLSDHDIQTIKSLYLTAKAKRNHGTIIKLHNKIIEITNIKTDLDPIDFVDLVIKDYNYYTQGNQ